MATVKLFWKDPYLQSFTGAIVKKFILNNKPAVILDQTAFYATSGGQPHDTGNLGGVRVIDVIEDVHTNNNNNNNSNNNEKKGETIIHILEKEIKEKEGEEVKGEIDWTRRMDHMQQHHGQHLLSKAFIDIANASTVSFHMGKDVSYIDLDSRDLSEEDQQRAQEQVNHIVYLNKPVQTHFYTLEEAKKLPLRKLDDAVTEPVRIVQVGEGEGLFDMQACCGTHPFVTGQVQSLAIVNYERIKKTTRLYFVCGLRAVNLLYKQSQVLKRIGLRLTAPPDADSVEKAFEQQQNEVANLRKTLAENEKIIIKSIVSEVEKSKLHPHATLPNVTVGCTELEGKDMGTIRTVAKQVLATHTSTLIALLARASDSDATSFVIGATPDLAADLRPLLKEVFAKFPGKGGGDGRFVQGSFSSKEVGSIVENIAERLSAITLNAAPSKK